jgi:hypothetical protein
MKHHGRDAHLLVILPGGEFRVALTAETTSIGTHPSSTLALQDPAIAERHCVIQRENDRYEIFDLHSASGTKVNGQRVEAAELRTGDQILLGEVRIVFLRSAETAAPAARPPAPKDAEVIQFLDERWDRLRENPFFNRKRPSKGAEKVADALRLPWSGAPDGPAAPSPTPPPPEPPPHAGPRPRRDHESLAEEVATGLKRSPCLIISAIVHAFVLAILNWFTHSTPPRDEPRPFEVSLESLDLDEVSELDRMDPPPEIEIDPHDARPEVRDPVEPILDLAPVDVPQRPADEYRYPGASEGPPLELPFVAGQGPGGGGFSGLGGSGPLAGGSEGFRRYVRSLRESGLDIAFVIDSTGSMGSVIEHARQQVDGMIAALAALVPGFRLGIVTYRDRKDAYVTRQEDLTPFAHQAVHFLDSIQAEGGGDEPESVLAGLKAASSGFKWAPSARRIIILLGDATPHEAEVDDCLRLATDFAARRGTIHAMVTASPAVGTRGGPSDRTLKAFQAIAQKGRGLCVSLDQGTEIVSWIMKLSFGAGNEESAEAALAQVEKDWRTQHFRGVIGRGDLLALRDAFRRKPPPQVLFRELSRAGKINSLPIYIDAVLDDTLPPETRWAASVLIGRLFRGVNAELSKLASEFTPEGSPTAISARAARLRSTASALGFPVTTDTQEASTAPQPLRERKRPPPRDVK